MDDCVNVSWADPEWGGAGGPDTPLELPDS